MSMLFHLVVQQTCASFWQGTLLGLRILLSAHPVLSDLVWGLPCVEDWCLISCQDWRFNMRAALKVKGNLHVTFCNCRWNPWVVPQATIHDKATPVSFDWSLQAIGATCLRVHIRSDLSDCVFVRVWRLHSRCGEIAIIKQRCKCAAKHSATPINC